MRTRTALARKLTSGLPTSPLLRHEHARQSDDARARLMAHALDALTAVVPAAVAVLSPVDRRLSVFTSGPVVARLDPPTLSVDLERIHAAYLAGASSDDPFEPRRWADGTVTAIGVGDVGGTVPRCDLLAAHNLSRCAAVFVRDRGRLVAYAVLMRDLGDPGPTAAEIERLRRVQPLVEEALLLVGERPPTPVAGEELLEARGLTRREAEVAVLAASGATNDEIARELHISVNTVKTHIGRALAKLGLRSRTELALRFSEWR